MSGTDTDSSIVFVGESHKVQIHSIPNTPNNITTIPETQEQISVPETPSKSTTKKKILNFPGTSTTIPETQGNNLLQNILNTF